MYLSHEQVHELAEACGSHRLVVLFLAYTGVRFGEMAALRVGRLDLMRQRATIAESVTLVRGVQTWGTPKGHERREVPIPRFLVDDLAAHVAGREPGALVFTAVKGGALRAQGFQRTVLTETAASLGRKGLHPHALRHTAASLAIASGANVKVVQQMLGHKSAIMTLDLYAAPVPGPAGRGRRPSGRRGSRCCVPVVYPGRHHPDVGELRNDQSPRKPGGLNVAPTGFTHLTLPTKRIV